MGQEYRIKNWHKLIVKERVRNQKYYYRMRQRMYELLGNQCARCGVDDKRVFQIDHVEGGGNSRKIINRSGQGATKKMLNEIEAGSTKYQLLCANCNIIKKHEKEEITGHIRADFYKENIADKSLAQRKTINI